MSTSRGQVNKILASKKSKVIKVDIEGGRSPQPAFIVMHPEMLSGVDIVHETTKFPYPFPDNTVTLFMAGHVIEHISRDNKGFVKFMDECWRCLKEGGQLMLSSYYAGSTPFMSDPTNVNPVTAQTWYYFDPEHPSGLYLRYKPKPWKIERCFWSADGNMEVLLSKRTI